MLRFRGVVWCCIGCGIVQGVVWALHVGGGTSSSMILALSIEDGIPIILLDGGPLLTLFDDLGWLLLDDDGLAKACLFFHQALQYYPR